MSAARKVLVALPITFAVTLLVYFLVVRTVCRRGVYPEVPMALYNNRAQLVESFGKPRREHLTTLSAAATELNILAEQAKRDIRRTDPVLLSRWERRCWFDPIEELSAISDATTGELIAAEMHMYFY